MVDCIIIISVVVGILFVLYAFFGGYFVNRIMPHDYMKQGDKVHIFLNDEYNRDATISKVNERFIYIYDKLPLPLSYRGKFYAMGKDTDGSRFIYVKKRFYIIPCRIVERFRKSIGLDQYLGNLPETTDEANEQEEEKEDDDEV